MEHVGQRLPLMSLFIFLVHHFSLIIYLVSFIYSPNWWRCFSRNNMFISFITFYPCPSQSDISNIWISNFALSYNTFFMHHACMHVCSCYSVMLLIMPAIIIGSLLSFQVISRGGVMDLVNGEKQTFRFAWNYSLLLRYGWRIFRL